MIDQKNKQDQTSGETKQQDVKSKQTSSLGGASLLARVTTLAWNLVLPIVGGVLLGYYLDERAGDGLTWTLSLLVLGVLIAFSNLYNLYIEQGRDQLNEKKEENEKRESQEE